MSAALTFYRVAGDSRYITVDCRNHLATGEDISAVAWTPETGVTEVALTSAISGSLITAKFDTPTAGLFRIDIQLTTTTPGETIKRWVFIQVVTPPAT